MTPAALGLSTSALALRLGDRILATLFVAGGAFLVYLVMFDQRAAVAAVAGAIGVHGSQPNYLHELFHDGRHLGGAPCH